MSGDHAGGGDAGDPGTRTAVLAGPDPEDLGTALEDRGVSVSRIEERASGSALEDAGVGTADLFVLTDVGQATAIPVAVDLAGSPEALRVVVYARESLPAFAKGQADLLVDPELLDPEAVAEELTR